MILISFISYTDDDHDRAPTKLMTDTDRQSHRLMGSQTGIFGIYNH